MAYYWAAAERDMSADSVFTSHALLIVIIQPISR